MRTEQITCHLQIIPLVFNLTLWYWIIDNRYLVPEYDNLKSVIMSTVQKLFDCRNYESDKSSANDFILRKTAKVSPLGANRWQLEEKGFLDYSSNQGGA